MRLRDWSLRVQREDLKRNVADTDYSILCYLMSNFRILITSRCAKVIYRMVVLAPTSIGALGNVHR
jgi:hypothetical protein